MKNWTKYENEIKAIGLDFAVTKDGEVKNCERENCGGCIFNTGGRCEPHRLRWLFEEWLEGSPKLTKKEQTIVEAFSTPEACYIARDKSGVLEIYRNRPLLGEVSWMAVMSSLPINGELFKFITWESQKPWSIEELLRLEVEQ